MDGADSVGDYDYVDDDMGWLKVMECTGLGTRLPLGPAPVAHGPAVGESPVRALTREPSRGIYARISGER